MGVGVFVGVGVGANVGIGVGVTLAIKLSTCKLSLLSEILHATKPKSTKKTATRIFNRNDFIKRTIPGQPKEVIISI
jgi:hypothetical protein